MMYRMTWQGLQPIDLSLKLTAWQLRFPNPKSILIQKGGLGECFALERLSYFIRWLSDALHEILDFDQRIARVSPRET